MRKVEPIGSGRWRYTIFFPEKDRTQSYTSPPTTIEPIKGPLDNLADARFAPEVDFDLLNEALRLSTIYEYERLVSLSSSRINLEPYQVFAVHQVISRFPHRYLIADDTGLGKTIEAGMILEELTARGRGDRVLIVAPAAVAPQWREELRHVFNRDYVFYDGPYLRQLMEKLPPEQNPWDRENRIITTLDLAKREEILAQLERTRWDIVVFDEAHKLSARRYGSKIEATQRYRLAQALAERTDSLLLLTATPHNGDRYAFHALLTLLDEYAFPDLNSVTRSQVARVVIRRTKREILDETG
ncbi:DEAD/DEAH box helicase, partial [Candidatus Bipolaricaulota bacterium]|nr:DEAD/DEAH box helicase [Candidatus Bipolaricaulota bacterium]